MKKLTILYRSLTLATGLLLAQFGANAQYTGGSGKGDTVNQYQYTQSVSSNAGTYAATMLQNNGDTLLYSADGNFDGDIDSLMAKIADAPGGNELGSVTISTQRFANGFFNKTERYFVPRKSRIMPASNGDAYLSLYFSQSDFDAYNAQAQYQLKVPVNGSDVQNYKANIRLMMSSGSIETANLNTIPASDVVYHANGAYWEVKAPIVGGVQGDYMLTTNFTSLLSAAPIFHFAQAPVLGDTITKVMLVWQSGIGATGYELRIRKQGTSTWTSYHEVNPSKLMELAFSTNYEVQVRVKQSATIQSEFTTVYTFNTPNNPSFLPDCMAPTNVNAGDIGPQSVTISWDTAYNAGSYFVYIKLASDTSWGAGGGTTTNNSSLTFNSLTPNTTYEYRVRTKCLTGTTQNQNSVFSPIYEFTTTNPLPGCLPPTGIEAAATSPSSVIVRWNPSQLATNYHVTLMPASQTSWVGSGGFTVSGNTAEFKYLQPMTDYKYKIRSICPVGTSSGNTLSLFSDVYTFRTGYSGKPAIDQNVYFYPNPTGDLVTVDYLTTDQEPRVLSVFDMTGRLLQQQTLASIPGRNNAQLSLKAYTNGMYIIQIQSGDAIQFVGRVVKQD
ncbi:MAG: fibronectin type III domain-containing protein [Chitinophagaceae bacterium]